MKWNVFLIYMIRCQVRSLNAGKFWINEGWLADHD